MTARITVDADLAGIRAIGPWLRAVDHPIADDVAARVELAVHEVAANIVQHGGRVGSTIELTTEIAVDGRRLIVRVVDDGAPFDPGDQQEPATGTPRVHGYGLVIVRRLTTDLTHGRRDGRNHTQLVFELPDRDRAGRRRTALVVDDDTASRVVLRVLLERSGMAVIEAVDGHDALARLDASEVDLIISDHQMPGMSGLELREHLAGRLGAPFVLLTGYATAQEFAPGDLAGVDAYLTKPVSSEAIRGLLHRFGRGDRVPPSGRVEGPAPPRSRAELRGIRPS